MNDEAKTIELAFAPYLTDEEKLNFAVELSPMGSGFLVCLGTRERQFSWRDYAVTTGDNGETVLSSVAKHFIAALRLADDIENSVLYAKGRVLRELRGILNEIGHEKADEDVFKRFEAIACDREHLTPDAFRPAFILTHSRVDLLIQELRAEIVSLAKGPEVE